MQESFRIHNFTNAGGQRVVNAYRFVSSQPSWLSRTAMMVFLIVVALPLFLLFLFALLLAVLAFFVLAGANALIQSVKRLFAGGDGRSNVRVITRRE